MKKLIVDKNKCIGCGACTMIAPGTFALDGDGKSKIVNQQGDNEEAVKNAIDNCPVKAISQED